MTNLPSTRPYLIRAIHQWCEDSGFTAYLAVSVDGSVKVPRQHVIDGEIVLNVSLNATSGLMLGTEFIEFKARFGGVPQVVSIPVGRVQAIYARENGQGMAFPVEAVSNKQLEGADDAENEVRADRSAALSLVELPTATEVGETGGKDAGMVEEESKGKKSDHKRPSLTRIK